MRTFTVCDSVGRIIRTGVCLDEELSMQAAEGETVFPGFADPSLGFFVEGEFVPFPDKPTEYHIWDWNTKAWNPSVDSAREAKLQHVNTVLNHRLYLPCNGFDADQLARERISGMIARLQRGTGLPPGWAGWRDAANVNHWATASAAEVLAHLCTLAGAIEDREQALLVAAWAHKDAIQQLTSFDALLAYDPTQGWPA